MEHKHHGGARAGAGRPRVRRKISKDAALALKLIAWQRYGRPTTDGEEDAILIALIDEERRRAIWPRAPLSSADDATMELPL